MESSKGWPGNLFPAGTTFAEILYSVDTSRSRAVADAALLEALPKER